MASGFLTAPSRFATQNFEPELRAIAAELDGADPLAAIVATLDAIRAELFRLRREKLALSGTRAEATGNLIDAGDAFVSGAAARLMAAARAGDTAAAVRLDRASKNILAVLRGDTPVADAAANVAATVEGIAADTRAAAQGGASALPWIVGGIAIVAGVYLWRTR